MKNDLFNITKKLGYPFSYRDDLTETSYNMGIAIVKQKQRFCGLEQGPESSKNVLHLVELGYVPLHEKELVKEYCLKGAEDKGSSEGIKFLNGN